VTDAVRTVFGLAYLSRLHKLIEVNACLAVSLPLLLHLDDEVDTAESAHDEEEQVKDANVDDVQDGEDKHHEAHHETVARPPVLISVVIEAENRVACA